MQFDFLKADLEQKANKVNQKIKRKLRIKIKKNWKR